MYICEICNKDFDNKSKLAKHIYDMHKQKPIYECHKCNKKYQHLKSYNKHMDNCNINVAIKEYCCPICNKKFEKSSAIGGHMACAHGKNNNKQEFICPICNEKLFTNKGAFKMHVKLHNEEFKNNKMDKFKKSIHDFFNDEEKSKKFRKIHSVRMQNDNPMFQEEAREKMKYSIQERIKNLSDNEYNKLVMNFINAPKKGNAIKHNGKYTPTKPEQMVIDFNIPGLVYNGNKKDSTTLRFANKKHKRSLTPDFIYKGTNKLIETFGIYWHPKEDEEKYIKACEENGYEVLIIWEDKLYENPELEKQRILKFLKGGIRYE